MSVDWWTLAIQAVNVAILIWLLSRVFWRPVAQMIAAREERIASRIAEAAKAEDRAEKDRKDIAETRAGFEQERRMILDAAKDAAEKLKADAKEAAREEAESIREQAKAERERHREEAAKAWRDRAATLATDIAGRLLARHDAAATRARFLDGLAEALASLSDRDRQAAAEGPLTLTTAAALPDDEAEAARRRVCEALGAEPEIAVETDPAVIAGFELEGPGLAVRSSWRADLDRILTEIRDDGHRR